MLVYFNGFCGGLLMTVVVVVVVLFWFFFSFSFFAVGCGCHMVVVVVVDGGCFGFFCGGLWLPRWC